MKCPVCKEPSLIMTDRQGIEVDYCPQCRGVWLDRGELDKIIERSVDGSSAGRSRGSYRETEPATRDRRPYRDDDDYDDDRSKYRKKRGSWLGELFDFD